MKIAIHSDLHLEGNRLPQNFGDNYKEIDVVILAGDIGVRALEFNLAEISACYPNSDIIFVPGNHEYYGFEFYSHNKEMESICEDYNIKMLKPGTGFIKDGYRFIGSTLWSDMSSLQGTVVESDKHIVETGVSDFYKIQDWSVDEMISRSRVEKLSIELMLMDGDNSKTIVIGHFPPLLEVRNPIFPNSALTSYFHNDWSDLIKQYKPLAWVYGHNHYNSPLKEYEGTLLLTNQRGYNKEPSNQSYDPNYMVEL